MKRYISCALLAAVILPAMLFAASCGEDLGPLESTAVFNIPAHDSRMQVVPSDGEPAHPYVANLHS